MRECQQYCFGNSPLGGSPVSNYLGHSTRHRQCTPARLIHHTSLLPNANTLHHPITYTISEYSVAPHKCQSITLCPLLYVKNASQKAKGDVAVICRVALTTYVGGLFHQASVSRLPRVLFVIAHLATALRFELKVSRDDRPYYRWGEFKN